MQPAHNLCKMLIAGAFNWPVDVKFVVVKTDIVLGIRRYL